MKKTVLFATVWSLAIGLAAEENTAPPISETAAAANIHSPGVYRFGSWEYIYRRSNPGSKSEGWYGELFYEGLSVPDAENLNDYLSTPWGPLYWAGRPIIAFGSHGWMPRPLANKPVGKNLTLPPLDDGGPTVWVMRLREDKVPDNDDQYRVWAEEIARQLAAGQEAPVIFRHRLSYHETCIHDSKHFGRLTARLLYPNDRENLAILISGTADPSRVTITRRNGAIGFVCPTLSGRFGDMRFALFFRVERASPEAALPIWVGLEAHGKTIEIRNTTRVVISLPLTEDRNLKWRLQHLEGEALRWAGEAVITPNFADIHKPGTEEMSFLVIRQGTANVTMHLSADAGDAPPTRVFKVAFTVPEEPPPLPGEQGKHPLLP